MAKLGLKYPVYAVESESGTTVSYASGAVLAKAISATIGIETNDVRLYADDAIAESDHSFSSGTVTIEIDNLTNAAQLALLGYTEGSTVDATASTKELKAGGSDSPAYVGFGFYGKKIVNKVSAWRAIWLKKVQFSEPDDAMSTKGQTVEFGTTTLEGTIMVASDGYWKEEGTFDTEEEAITWLNTKAGIPVSASGGLTGLTMTGTAGTLSPTFGAATRYYTFGGLTGTSFTLTATAAGHTIKLYDNGTLIQNLTSGVASSSVAMASVGTKKLTIVAQEAGKNPQTTEIIVVKTA